MKNKFGILIAGAFIALLSGCTKNDNQEILSATSLKARVEENSVSLNSAMDAITANRIFDVLSIIDQVSRSASADDYSVHITLDTIKGVYEYNNQLDGYNTWKNSLIDYFNKVADNEHMIIKMPLSKVERPYLLRHPVMADTSLHNDFVIDVSEYHNNYNSYHDYDYVLFSEITIDNDPAGSLNIKSIVSPEEGREYESVYEFSDGYKAKYRYISGDTIISSFSVTQNNNVLYGEELTITSNDSMMFGHERMYILTIGDIQIIRNNFSEVEILLNGVVQPGATISIVDNQPDTEASICKHRDIEITFGDGSVVLLSDLIEESIDDINSLYSSLHNVYFAAGIIDRLGYDIYYKR